MNQYYIAMLHFWTAGKYLKYIIPAISGTFMHSLNYIKVRNTYVGGNRL